MVFLKTKPAILFIALFVAIVSNAFSALEVDGRVTAEVVNDSEAKASLAKVLNLDYRHPQVVWNSETSALISSNFGDEFPFSWSAANTALFSDSNDEFSLALEQSYLEEEPLFGDGEIATERYSVAPQVTAQLTSLLDWQSSLVYRFDRVEDEDGSLEQHSGRMDMGALFRPQNDASLNAGFGIEIDDASRRSLDVYSAYNVDYVRFGLAARVGYLWRDTEADLASDVFAEATITANIANATLFLTASRETIDTISFVGVVGTERELVSNEYVILTTFEAGMRELLIGRNTVAEFLFSVGSSQTATEIDSSEVSDQQNFGQTTFLVTHFMNRSQVLNSSLSNTWDQDGSVQLLMLSYQRNLRENLQLGIEASTSGAREISSMINLTYLY